MAEIMAFVVDVNVAVVANNRDTHADLVCVKACVDKLVEIKTHSLVVLDDKMQILKEYMSNLNPSGQPGVGDAFMQWIWENQGVIKVCEQVTITPIGQHGDYVEFPRDTRLSTFDLSDRKYVAVALGSRNQPEIANAVDSDWWDHRQALQDCGVRVRFLCPHHVGDS